MPTVIVSSLSHTSGETIAKEAASALGYEYVGEDVYEDASRRSGMPLEKIRKALSGASSLLGRSASARKRCFAYLQAAVAGRLLKENVVFHGPFGHLLVVGVSHVLTVRVLAPAEERIAAKMKSEGCGRKEAEKSIAREDKQRLSIAEEIFGVDDDDERRFDLVINTAEMDVASAVGIIVETARQERYKPMTYSLQRMEDIELSCRVRAALVDLDSDARVEAKKGDVRIRAKSSGRSTDKKMGEIRRVAEQQDGVVKVTVEAVSDLVDLIDKRLH
jgi:cytidylate kinase